MRVMVTGGCGFIGSHVCEYYRSKGAEVVSYDNMTKYELNRTGFMVEAARDYNWNLLKGLGVTMLKEDVRDLNALSKAAEGCDFIVHTAAQPAMTIAMESPELDFTTNAYGTFNVMETARKKDIPVVSCSSIHVYGNGINDDLKEEETRYTRNPPGIDETHPVTTGTLTPLHASKRSAELYVQTYADTYGVKAATFRLTGLYGPRQFGGEDHGWVANFTIRVTLGLPINIYGTGKQVRDILYATDLAEAFNAFYEHQKPGIYNVGSGPGQTISLLECIDYLEQITGKKPKIDFHPPRLGDLYYFVCDISKVTRELKWTPKIGNKEGIKKLSDWAIKNAHLFKG